MNMNVRSRGTAAKQGKTGEGYIGHIQKPFDELSELVMNTLLWEPDYYRKGEEIKNRIADLISKSDPREVANLAIMAREDFYMRHTPVFMVRELARHARGEKYQGLVANTIARVIRRADEIPLFLFMWGDEPLSNQARKGLARAFAKLSQGGEYRLAKYANKPGKFSLADAAKLVHAKGDQTGGFVIAPAINKKNYKRGKVLRHPDSILARLIRGELKAPGTWESRVSAGENKKKVFEELLTPKENGFISLGYDALLKNLRLMEQNGVDRALISNALIRGASTAKAFPHQFFMASTMAPAFENDIDVALGTRLATLPRIPGKTLLLVDRSGSMDQAIAGGSDMKRSMVAAALASQVAGVCEDYTIMLFNESVHPVGGMKGVRLFKHIRENTGGGTMIGRCLKAALGVAGKVDRVIIITDEENNAGDPGTGKAPVAQSYMMNIASAEAKVARTDLGWTRIAGFSDKILTYVMAHEGISFGAEEDDE